jgi:hypothetical protein
MSTTTRAVVRANRLCQADRVLDNDDDSRLVLLQPFRKSIRFTAAQMLTGRTNPIELIPGIPGVLLVPRTWMWLVDVSVAFSENRTWGFQYDTLDFSFGTATITLNATGFRQTTNNSVGGVTNATERRGLSIVWRANTDMSGSQGAFTDNILTVTYDTISFDDLR